MKLRRVIGMAVAFNLLMTSAAAVSVNTAFAETIDTADAYSEDFNGFGETNYKDTLLALENNGWYMADQDTLYTNISSVAPYSTYGGKIAKITSTGGEPCMMVVSAGEGSSTDNSDVPYYGYGKTFPGVSAGGAATGSWEISFDFKPALLKVNNKYQTQFSFTLNTGDSSATGKTAQHNIISGYDQKFYLGYRDHSKLQSSGVTQGTLKAADIGGAIWYTVKTTVNCDAHYYSVELYNKATGKLIARRSPISFAANETIGFLKFSALGYSAAYYVYVDNVSIEKAAENKTIYNETFDTFTNDSYSAAEGMTTGGSAEDVKGDSYFEGYTPWRFHSSVGNSYSFETDPDLNSQVVRLGAEGAGSGLVYMPPYDPLLSLSTEPLRGMLKTSFKIRPETVVNDVTVNAIASVSDDITSNDFAYFKITNHEGSPAVINTAGEYVDLEASEWYNVEQSFDVVGHTVTTKVKDLEGTEVASNVISGSAAPFAVRAIMFKVDGDSSVLMDDIKLEYCPVDERPVDIGSVTVDNAPLRSLSAVTPGSTVNVEVKTANDTGEAMPYTAVLAFYNGERFVGMQSLAGSAAAGATGTQDKEFTIPSDMDMEAVDKMSVFLWDGLETLTPLTGRKDYIRKNHSSDEYKDYVDFVVEVESGRSPVILQITDPQIIDSTQVREGVAYSQQKRDFWQPANMNKLLFNDLRSLIEDVQPDLILATGDLVYGGYDDLGTSFTRLADFMDSFDIPWAPVFGNHDNESKMGVDWQCNYLESCENCLFKQRTLTGNGNYSIGIVQGGELKRVIFMLDSNGCAVMSDESFANGHSKKSGGFGEDQIAWYTRAAEKINADFPGMRYTFAFHIQLAAFADAFYNTYGFVNGGEVDENKNLVNPLNIDEREDKRPTDFGYIGRSLKTPWDDDRSVYNGIKALGADSILVGHEHCNSASVVYDGIRFQFGQKIGEYDRINFRASDGKIIGFIAIETSIGTPILGGTVMEMNETTGEIDNAYIHYCEK
ncbi:MAG: metallophosphoesterase [Clostridia bacterium]|nr:metallophosphoesterase [Clostridia bacterium]